MCFEEVLPDIFQSKHSNKDQHGAQEKNTFEILIYAGWICNTYFVYGCTICQYNKLLAYATVFKKKFYGVVDVFLKIGFIFTSF